MITLSVPTNWQDLQNQVAKILTECGFNVDVEKTITTVRGDVEVDVYAEETVKGRKYIILCECKHWKANIPKNVIHGFRTVMQDVGANSGYVIVTSDFQSGAFTAAELTNIDLVTWEQFQELFNESWLENYFSPTVTEELDRLMGFTEPLVQPWMCKIPDKDVEIVKTLRDKYLPLCVLAMGFSTYMGMINKREFPELPIRGRFNDRYKEGAWLPDEVLDATGYRELLNSMVKHGTEGEHGFLAVRERNNV